MRGWRRPTAEPILPIASGLAARQERRLEARALGITGVPFFVVDRRYGISGAQPADLFLQALETARADGSPAPGARRASLN